MLRESGEEILIIGAGPSGLFAAAELARLAHEARSFTLARLKKTVVRDEAQQ